MTLRQVEGNVYSYGNFSSHPVRKLDKIICNLLILKEENCCDTGEITRPKKPYNCPNF